MSSKGNSAMMAVALLVTAMALILSAGCFGGPHHQSTDCTIDVKVVVENNQADPHVFTYLVELVQVKDQTCSCPQGYTLVDGTCTMTTYGSCIDCPKTWIDTSHWGSFGSCEDCSHHHEDVCVQTCNYQYCKSNGQKGSSGNHQYHLGQCIDYDNVKVYDCHVGNDAYSQNGCQANHEKYRSWITEGYWQYNCHTSGYVSCGQNKEMSVTTSTVAQTCTCPTGYIKSGDTCEKVVDSESNIPSQQGNPATVTLTYQNDGFWYGWRWHLRWHDRFGVLHDRCFGELDQNSDYVIRVTDTGTDLGYVKGALSQTFNTDICGGDVIFQYIGPFCPQTECPVGSYCAGSPVNPVCVPNFCDGEHPCPGGYQCVGNQCVPVPCDALHPCPPGSHCEAGACVPDVIPPGSGGPGDLGGGAACPGLVQYTHYFVPYCDYQWPYQAPALVQFKDTVLCNTDRISGVFDFGEGYSDVDACLVDAYNGMGTPENLSVCELRLRTYTEPDPTSTSYIKVEHLYVNPGTYHVILSAVWSSAPSQVIHQDNTVTVEPGRGECTVLEPGDTYHKPWVIRLR